MDSSDAAASGAAASADERVDANAATALRRPYAMVLLLAMVAGAMDARDYQSFGVFTANQAGNMVLLWVKLLDQPGIALLSLGSLLGAGLGIAFVVFLRSRGHWFSGVAGTRALLYLSAAVLAATSVLGTELFAVTGAQSEQALGVWTSPWLGAMVSVMLSAFSLGMLATIFVAVGNNKAGVIAVTGPFVDGVRYLTANAIFRDPRFRRKWKYALSLPASWSLGALIVGLSPVNRASITMGGVVVVVAIALFAQRDQPA